MKLINISVFIIIIFFFSSCNSGKNKKEVNQVVDEKELSLSLEELNRKMIQYESDLINEYVEKNSLNVIKTGTGLRYQILNEGEGELIKKGDIVSLEYELSLLSGELLYSSDNDGNKVFLVSRGGVESGLEEAVLKLRKNSEAILILPSHLAHGLIGDGNRIPPKAILVYSIKVIDIK